MLRRILLLLVMLTVPNLASAYNYWSITASTSPAIANAVSPPTDSGTNTYATTGAVTYVTSGSTTTAPFTVAAAPQGYQLSYVNIDGVRATPVNGVYTVNKGTRVTHTISAVYAVQKYTISTSKTGSGLIDPSATVSYGATKTIRVAAATGCQFTVSAPSATLTAGEGVTYGEYTFTSIASDKTVSATFTAIPAVTAKIATSPQNVVLNTPLTIDGSTSTSTVTPNFTWSVTPAGASIVSQAGGKATFTASKAGAYTVTLTLSGQNVADSSAHVAITASTRAIADSNVCTSCHGSREPGLVASYTGSKHASTATASCQACHTSANDGMYLPADAAAAAAPCEGCHRAALSTTTHPVAITAAKCAECHNPHDPGAGIPNLGQAPAHPAVTLYTFEEIGMQMAGGQKVPVQVDASGKGLPYSPKQTCGTAGCHVKGGVDYTYDKIADHAFHAAQGMNEYVDSPSGKYDATKNKPWLQSTAMVGKW